MVTELTELYPLVIMALTFRGNPFSNSVDTLMCHQNQFFQTNMDC